ncbi:hypothetical protein [Acetobacter sp.]|uniref:hypothetical protein n=1 Tax=Acetobacter sp. TaxID=440 RepID=UPI0039EB4511
MKTTSHPVMRTAATPDNLQPVRVEAVARGRRSFLGTVLMSAAALAGVAALPGCTVTNTNGVTTLTIDVAKVKNYGQAGLNAAATVTSYLSSFPTMAPYALAITAGATALSGALSAFSAATGSTLTISYDDATWKTRLDSILTGMETVGDAIAKAIVGGASALPASVVTDAKTADNALATIISVFKALLGVSDAHAPFTRDMLLVGAPVPVTGMTEAQALKALGVS